MGQILVTFKIENKAYFLKIKHEFSLKMQNRDFNKNKLLHWFSEVKYASRAKFLGANPGDICNFQGTQEMEGNSLLISEGIMKETMAPNTREAAKVVSEDEDTVGSFEELDCQDGLLSKGSSKKRFYYSISLRQQKRIKTTSALLTGLLSQFQDS